MQPTEGPAMEHRISISYPSGCEERRAAPYSDSTLIPSMLLISFRILFPHSLRTLGFFDNPRNVFPCLISPVSSFREWPVPYPDTRFCKEPGTESPTRSNADQWRTMRSRILNQETQQNRIKESDKPAKSNQAIR